MDILLICIVVIALIYLFVRERAHKATEESFLSIVNHAFRTPLTRIKWQSENLSPDLSREEQLEITRNIGNGITSVLEIIDTLSGIQDIHSKVNYDLKAVSIREIIEGSIGKHRALLDQKKITFHMPTFTDMPLLTLDTKKITFVIDALLSNAIWYSKDGDMITIASSVERHGLTISIADTGIGLSGRDKRHLYKRFYRGEEARKINTDGMGVSLYLCKEIIRRHHGNLDAKSAGRNHGSTFLISLPFSRG